MSDWVRRNTCGSCAEYDYEGENRKGYCNRIGAYYYPNDRCTHWSEADGITSSTGGCYIATAVYGSYDCPQVWTLRRYRDDVLAQTWLGRSFIRTYYVISPTLVKWFGNTNWFTRFWRKKLNRFVSKLNAKGVEETPYEDIIWYFNKARNK